jgi:hypothetical protein
MKEEVVAKRWLEPLDPELSGAEQAEILEAALDSRVKSAVEAGTSPDLAQDDLDLLSEYAKDQYPDVRAVAVDFLASHGPCSWEDVEAWAKDPDEVVRENVLDRMDNSFWAAGKLCDKDKERCCDIVVSVIGTYVDYTAANLMESLRSQGDEWLELTWMAAEDILDLKRPELTLLLTCCYLEHVIPDSEWGPEDMHIREWIEGDDAGRKIILLKIANYRGVDEGRMADLVYALQSDPNEQIAATAEGILAGRIGVGTLWGSDEIDGIDDEEEEAEDPDDLEDE